MEAFKRFLDSIGECYLFGAGVVGYYTAKWMMEYTSVTVKKILVTVKEGNVDYYGGISVQSVDELEENEKESVIIIATLEALQGKIQEELLARGCNNIYALPENVYHGIRNTRLEMGMEWYQHFCRESLNLESLIQGLDIGIQNLYNRFIESYNRISESYNRRINVYLDGMDRYLYLEQWKEICGSKDFWQKLQNLTYGMDKHDVDEIYRIVHRLNLLNEDKPIIYSKEEEHILDEIEEVFLKRIFKISSDRYTYKNYILPIGHFEESVFWYEHGMKLLDNPAYILNKDAIDAGAFVGDSAIVMSKYIRGNIYSFEADAENYGYLKKTLEMNQLENVVPVNLALSDYVGKLNLYKEKNVESVQSNNTVMEANSLIDPIKKNDVFCTTIDEYVKEHRLKVGFIKTDVEGCEQNLLKGAVHTIKEQKPSMIISIYHNLDDFFEIKPWIESLQLGYTFKIFRPTIKYSFMTETVLICETKAEG